MDAGLQTSSSSSSTSTSSAPIVLKSSSSVVSGLLTSVPSSPSAVSPSAFFFPPGETRSPTVRFADCDRELSSVSLLSTSSPATLSSRHASCSVTVTSPVSSVTTTMASSSSSSPPHLSSSDPSPSASPQHVSPTSSAFVSASGSPFIAHDLPDTAGHSDNVEGKEIMLVNPPPLDEDPSTLTLANEENEELFLDTSNDTLQPSFSQASGPISPITFHFPAPQYDNIHQLSPAALFRTSTVSAAPPVDLPPVPRFSTSSSTSIRPRCCDVYIGMHGQSSALSRFSKWLRAELELQGIACFSADRAHYTDSRTHDIARGIINSCTFGVVIISKRTFRNLYSVEELQIFVERKNLVPIFFDLAPSDCLSRDIVERRGEVWEKDGGELWRLFAGDEREWREGVDGLARIEEWKLEACTGNWRNCILKAVSLLGTRLGRRSVAERERVRKEKVDGVEFPFPRNANFAGREKELRVLEGLLFARTEGPDNDWDEENERLKELSRSHFRRSDTERWMRCSNQALRESYVGRRRSDADRWQRRMSEGLEIGSARRKSDSDRLRGFSREIPEGHRFKEAFAAGEDGGVFSLSESHRGKELAWEIPEEEVQRETELCRTKNTFRFRDRHRSRYVHRERHLGRNRQTHSILRDHSTAVSYPTFSQEGGIACISGVSGIGKTELALEFAYRFSQKYRMVLWVGGEARYLRQNYLYLSLFLGVDVGTESQIGPEQGCIRTFDEQEMEAFQRVRRELQRDVPYLLIIDNLESERDWWDGREISELLPPAGGETHVIITTRLPKVLSLEPLELSYLSGVEALSLMRGKREFSSNELDALKKIEKKLGRLTLGLGIVGILLTELPIMPSELLEKIEKGLLREWTWGAREESTLKNHSFLVKLLGVCFSFLDQTDGPRDLATQIAWVGGWFAPFPIPISLLALAAAKFPQQSRGLKLWKSFRIACLCCCVSSQNRKLEADAGALLVKYGVAKRCSRQGWIYFHEIMQLYARKRGGVPAAKAMVQGVKKRGAISLHSEHFWAACFLVLGFGNDPIVVELKLIDLLSFIQGGVFQLALRAFTAFSRCHASLELLRLCTNMLDDVDRSLTQDWWDKLFCWCKNGPAGHQVDACVWPEVTILKAVLLEARAQLMLKGGQFDAGEEICRTCISIRTVMLGKDHPDTISAQETLAKMVRYRTHI